MTGLVSFMNTMSGRVLRVLLGIALIAYGILFLTTPLSVIVAVIGVVPLVMGLWGRCLLEPLARRPA